MNNKKQIVRSVLSVFLTLLVFCHIAHKTGLAEEKDVIVERYIIFGKGDDVELALDLARPAKMRGRLPALIFLFGGGYMYGSRISFSMEIREAAQRGYIAVTIDYRLTSARESGKVKYHFPSQVHDAKCAVRWLRANSRKYKIDKNRIGVVGYSAGGNLALMLGVTDPSVGLEGECGKMKYSSRVQAVVNLGGGTDMVMHYQTSRYYINTYMGGNPDDLPDQYRLVEMVN
jgi:acetyl esterase/lipase